MFVPRGLVASGSRNSPRVRDSSPAQRAIESAAYPHNREGTRPAVALLSEADREGDMPAGDTSNDTCKPDRKGSSTAKTHENRGFPRKDAEGVVSVRTAAAKKAAATRRRNATRSPDG